jgi:putative endonuclease
MRERSPCVYIMASGYLGTLYVGATSNLIGRVLQHRDEVFDGFTAEHNIKRLVWYDAADTMLDAFTFEKRLKRWKRDWKIALIERENPTWDDLAIGLGLPPLTRG